MPDTSESAPSTAERQAIAAEWKRLQDEPPRNERREIGCMTAVVALLVALVGPYLLGKFGIELHPA